MRHTRWVIYPLNYLKLPLYANRHLVNITRTQKLSCVAGAKFCGKGPRNSLLWQRLSRDRKTNFRSFICSRSSTNAANLVKKIGPTKSLKIHIKINK